MTASGGMVSSRLQKLQGAGSSRRERCRLAIVWRLVMMRIQQLKPPGCPKRQSIGTNWISRNVRQVGGFIHIVYILVWFASLSCLGLLLSLLSLFVIFVLGLGLFYPIRLNSINRLLSMGRHMGMRNNKTTRRTTEQQQEQQQEQQLEQQQKLAGRKA